jgi:hypothetical protein
MVTVQYMWIDDTSADVIKVDFEALYHGDFLVEGDTTEQFPDLAAAEVGMRQRWLRRVPRADSRRRIPSAASSI